MRHSAEDSAPMSSLSQPPEKTARRSQWQTAPRECSQQNSRPDSSLYEELETPDYRIASELHGYSKVYRRSDGTLAAELSEDAYLTYVTQLDDGRLVMQYVTADNDFYGVLMDSGFHELARLPYLCDISNGQAVFDYPDGNMRSTRFYTLAELIDFAGR